ncbi:hypothetical protein ACFC39_30025, partial [Streptomyces sp. NPDC056049]
MTTEARQHPLYARVPVPLAADRTPPPAPPSQQGYGPGPAARRQDAAPAAPAGRPSAPRPG